MKASASVNLTVLCLAVVCTLIPLAQRATTQTSNGHYEFKLAPGGDYTVAAAKTGITFSQPRLTFSAISENQKNADFTAAAITISGHVTNINGRGLSGKKVDLTGSDTQTLTTDANGLYSFTVASGGNYDVTPSDPNFIVGWFPANSIHHTGLTQNVTDDFEARTPAFTVAGVVKNTGATNLSGVTIRLTGTFIVGGNKVQLKDYSTNPSGSFTSDALNIFGDYSFTPQTSTVGGTTYNSFSPTSRSFNSILPCSSVPGATCDNNTSTQNYLGADFSAAAKTIQFDSANYTSAENVTSKVITITRSGDTSAPATVNYATSDLAGASQCNVFNSGNASSRCDYESTLGTLNFAAGESSKTISIPIVDDSYAEGNENFSVTLSNPTGAGLGTPNSVPVTIVDNDSANGANPISQARYFVRMHYLDFLNREPDTSGWDFWTNQITNCGSDVGCTEVRRIDVSASFFLSIEFQQTGYLVERTYKAAYGDTTGNSTFNGAHQLTVPIVRFDEFLGDTQQITRGVVVLQTGWEQLLESNKVAFFNEFVQRSRFTTAFPQSMNATDFVNKLNANAGSPLLPAEVTSLATSGKSRAEMLRAVAEHPNLVSAEFNRAFVLMQYFGYLRRNPNDPQDSDYSGYDFWLVKLNQFGGNYNSAEMVKAFITSIEYGRRFGP